MIIPYRIILPIIGTIKGSILLNKPKFLRATLLSLPAK